MRGQLIPIAIMATTTGGLWYYAASRPRPAGAPVIVGQLDGDEKHLVTSEMQSASDEVAGRDLPDGRLEAADGEIIDLGQRSSAGPLALIFIKDGCPCSTAAEPFFRRLHDAYGGRVGFVGLIDGDTTTARRWVDRHGTPFPVARDRGLEVARALGVTNSAYVAVVERGGRVARVWPGFSASMLEELSGELAGLAGVERVAIDTSDAPAELYTGCPFDLSGGQDDSSTVPARRPE